MTDVARTTLADVCSSVDYGYTAKSTRDPQVGPKYLRITDIVPPFIDWSSVPHCPIESAKRAKYLLEEGDIVIARSGSVGYAKQIWARPQGATFASYLVRFRPNPALVEPRYLGQIIQSGFFRDWVTSVAGGVAQPNANAKLLGSFELHLPPRDIQCRVAAVLGTFEQRLENNQRRIEILEEMARLIYREWFVHFRFPGHEDVELVDSQLGRIPKGWEPGMFGDLVEVSREAAEPDEIEPGEPLVGLEHLPRRSTTLHNWDRADEVGSRKSVFVAGDILFGKIRPYFHKVALAPTNGYCSTDAIVFRPEPEGRGQALAVASSDEFVAHAVQTSNGTKMPRANTDVLLQYPVAIPRPEVGEAFEAVAGPMNLLCEHLSVQIRLLREARDLLLPRLISGELDVSDLDLDLEPVA